VTMALDHATDESPALSVTWSCRSEAIWSVCSRAQRGTERVAISRRDAKEVHMTDQQGQGLDDTNAPKEDRVGNDYREGSNPQPGGDIDLSGSAVPPYDDRSTGDEEVAAGVPRAMGSAAPAKEPVQPGADGPDETDPSDAPPAHTGESTTRRGEDVGDDKGKEAGRPTGESTMRDRTGVDPEETNTGRIT
jgi:hypothetical protein